MSLPFKYYVVGKIMSKLSRSMFFSIALFVLLFGKISYAVEPKLIYETIDGRIVEVTAVRKIESVNFSSQDHVKILLIKNFEFANFFDLAKFYVNNRFQLEFLEQIYFDGKLERNFDVFAFKKFLEYGLKVAGSFKDFHWSEKELATAVFVFMRAQDPVFRELSKFNIDLPNYDVNVGLKEFLGSHGEILIPAFKERQRLPSRKRKSVLSESNKEIVNFKRQKLFK